MLLGLAFATLLLSRERPRLPSIWLPLILFVSGTLISVAFSGNAMAGLPQVRKIFVFLELAVVYSLLRDVVWLRRLFLCWAAAGGLIAVRGLIQFASKIHQAQLLHRSFYEFYIGGRITGFASHWMTYSAQEMLVLLMLLSFLLFGPRLGRLRWIWVFCAALVSVALLLGLTRGVWLAAAAGGLYLLWSWDRIIAMAAPVAGVLMLLLAPAWLAERFTSIVRPGPADSNQFRKITLRTGLEIIKAHPWLGIGPEEVRMQFERWVPSDTPRPLPPGYYGHLHNLYIHYAAERGIPTTLVLVWLLVRVIVDFSRALRKLARGPGELRFLLHGGIAIVIAVMIEGLFEVNLGDSEVLAMFLIVVGCGYVAFDCAGLREREPVIV